VKVNNTITTENTLVADKLRKQWSWQVYFGIGN